MAEDNRVNFRVKPNSALSRLIAAGKADGRTVAATLHDAVTRLEVMERPRQPVEYTWTQVPSQEEIDRRGRMLNEAYENLEKP